MNNSVIVWDLETVPDLNGFAAANQLVGKTNEEIREALGNKLPKNIVGRPRRNELFVGGFKPVICQTDQAQK